MFQEFDPHRPEPTRVAVDAMKGPAVLEFGANWCPICQGAQPLIKDALAKYPEIEHIKVEDGKGKPLGRSYKVKLWPTLVFLKDGQEMARLVRPDNGDAIAKALGELRVNG